MLILQNYYPQIYTEIKKLYIKKPVRNRNAVKYNQSPCTFLKFQKSKAKLSVTLVYFQNKTLFVTQ